jgi:multiple RNA-binding domain-containing protein 1
MGIAKSELINPSSEEGGDGPSAAVKLALAETHVIEETKRYFEEQGIVLESLQPKTTRSLTTILVKNIPFGTSIESVTEMFEIHGKLKRVLLPPAGTLGVVEFEDSGDAAKAFRAVSYRRMGNAVIYLEKGPVGMFSNSAKPPVPTKEVKESLVQSTAGPESAVRTAPVDTDATALDSAATEDEPNSTLFIKNLSFTTNQSALYTLLSALDGFSFCRVQTKPDPKRPGERLSMGYGFAGFKTRTAATKALKGLNAMEVDGKTWEVKFGKRGAEEETQADSNELKGRKGSTKVLVKNLPFEATKKDVKELFRLVT